MTPARTRLLPPTRWCWSWGLIVGVWAWFCWPLLVGTDVIGFRDSGYLYYPLFHHIDQVWASGHIPLWSPYDGLGRPLLADGSASVFYPGKILFLLRFLDYDVRYGWYLALHLLLAALSTWHVARRWGASPAGAFVAGLSYAFSGVVLFQSTNAIYLVGAAWLPWGLWSVHQTVTTDQWYCPWLGGIVVAMMLLGGDPQSAYHLGLIGAATVVGTMRKRAGAEGRWWRPWRRLGRLGLWSGLALGLAAVQILPTVPWARNSRRQQYDDPRTIYEAFANPTFYANDSAQHPGSWRRGILGTPKAGTHAEQIYQFSQPPWTVVEFALPNVGGKPFPEHRRWLNHLPGADRMWTPSLYFGLVGLVFALTRYRIRKQPGCDRWLSRIAIFFLVASWGWYGPVWLVREMTWWIGASPDSASGVASDWGPQVGGLYWAMVTLLPQYVMFRYPAKLMVIVCLAVSLLAGRGIANLEKAGIETCRKSILRVCAAISALALAALAIGATGLAGDTNPFDSATDPLFGPLCEGAIKDALIQAGAHAVAVSIAIGAVVGLGVGRRRDSGMRSGPDDEVTGTRRLVPALLVLTSILDVSVANAWLLPLVPSTVFHEPVPIRYRLVESTAWPVPHLVPAPQGSTRELAFRAAHFAETSSPERLSQIIRVQRAWAIPKWHLAVPAKSLESFSSIEPRRSIARSQEALLRLRRVTERAFWWGAAISLATLAIASAFVFGRWVRSGNGR